MVALSLMFLACSNSFEKEAKEIDGLLELVDSAERILNTVDTAKVFSLTRGIKKELWNLGVNYDTLDKETAIEVATYYSNKKSLYFLYENYLIFINEIELARTQLNDLKQDLHNGAIQEKVFLTYYKNEQAIILSLHDRINNAVKEIDPSVNKLIEDKLSMMELLNKYRKDTVVIYE